MTRINSKVVKLTSFVTSVLFALGVSLPALLMAVPASAAQLTSGATSIEMSSSTPSQTGVSYKVTFTPQTSEASGVVYVDFCSNSPLDGDTCNDAYTGVPNVSSVAGPATTTAVTAGDSQVHTIKLTGQTLTSGTPFTATFTGIVNPTTAGSFYARIYTGASGYTYTPAATNGGTPTSTGYADYGGVAMSTASVVSITARVMPTLTFCVSSGTGANGATNPITSNCGGTVAPNITIGHGSQDVLSSSQVDTYSVFSQLSTNATAGAVIRADINNSGTNTCGGLLLTGAAACSAGNYIPPVNNGNAAGGTITAGTAAFGLSVANGTGGTGTVSAFGCYTSAAYCMDTTANTGVTSTFGSEVASSTGPVNNVNNQYTFGATVSNTTPAGIYTANMSLIATGTF